MLLGSKLAMPQGVIISRRLTIGKRKIGSQVSDRCPLGYLFYVIWSRCFTSCFCIVLLVIYMQPVTDQLPRWGKRKLIFLISFTCKLTQNKNARHIFPHNFISVAMVGIICLHVHFLLYTLHTRSIFFSNTYTTSGHMTITTKNARARRAPNQEVFRYKKLFLTFLRSFTEQQTCLKKD